MESIKRNNSIYILSAEAKDLYEANHRRQPSVIGYDVRDVDGKIRVNRFLNTLDYSLDLIKLREVYRSAYRNSGFSFMQGDKEYSQQVINVSFKHSYKRFNQIRRFNAKVGDVCPYFIRAGYSFDELKFIDNVAFVNGELAGVCVETPVEHPYPPERLGEVFRYDKEKKCYKVNPNQNETLLTTKQLREDLYVNGFYCDGVKYVRFKRSSGSARIGKCLFVNEALYGRMHCWEKCGLTIRQGQRIDLAAWEAYISLTTSSIIDTLEIKPENILLIDDYKSAFTDTCLAVKLEGKKLNTEAAEVDIENSIWDGQSLLDASMFTGYENRGMLLLRTRFFKSACFNTNIQKFFRDNGITDVSQLNGQTRAKSIEDIKLITTPSSVKFLKFGSFDQWLDTLEPEFGIVKHDKPSHYFGGRMVQCHYQLLNTLHMSYEDTERLLEPSRQYFHALDTDPAVFRWHVKSDGRSVDGFDVLTSQNEIAYYLLGVNEEFTETAMYHKWKQETLSAFRNAIRCGHVLIEGTYATLLGNPYEMLLSSVGAFDGVSRLGKGHVYCPMFADGEELLGSRSPHVAAGNILLTVNRKCEELERYFNLSPYIVCINSIEENTLERLSGADMDSDTMLLTPNKTLVEKAKQHYSDFLVPTQLVPAQLKKRKFTDESKADLDYVTSTNRIGEIVNLSQELNSMFWDKLNNGARFEDIKDIYSDIAKLDVLSTIEIDSAKREFPVNTLKEMKAIRQKYNATDEDGRRIKPHFFGHISKRKGYYNDVRNHYKRHDTTMDYVQQIVRKWRCKRVKPDALKPFTSVLALNSRLSDKRAQTQKVQSLFDNIRYMSMRVRELWEKVSNVPLDDKSQRRCLIKQIDEYYTNMIDFVNTYSMTDSTIAYMLRSIEEPENVDICKNIMRLFFTGDSRHFRRFLRNSEQSVPLLTEKSDGEVQLYGFKFAKTCKNQFT